MDPFVTLAKHYADSRPGLGHSALPGAPQLPIDDRRPATRRLLESWRRLLARRSDRSRRRPVRSRPTARLPVRSSRAIPGG